MRSIIICSLVVVVAFALPRHKRQDNSGAIVEEYQEEIHVEGDGGELHAGQLIDSNGNKLKVIAAKDKNGNGGIHFEGQGPVFRKKRDTDDEVIDITDP